MPAPKTKFQIQREIDVSLAKYNPRARAWLLADGRDARAAYGSCLACGTRPVFTEVDGTKLCQKCAAEWVTE